jgi:hypothetical protein
MEHDQMRLEFTYTGDDFVEAQVAATGTALGDEHNSRGRSVARRLLGWILFLALTVCLYYLLQKTATRPTPAAAPTQPQSDTLLEWVVPMLPWLLVFGFIWFLVFRQLRAARRVWEHDPALRQPQTMDLTETCIRLADTLSASEWRWEAFTGVTETANLFVLKRGEGSVVIIPKRGAPPGQLDALRLLLAERVHEPGAFPVLPPKPPPSAAP